MTENTTLRTEKQENCSATLREEHLKSMLNMLFPALKPAHEAALAQRGAQTVPQTVQLEQLADASSSTIECIFMPEMHYPTLLLNDQHGCVRGFELRAVKHGRYRVYEIVELSKDVAHARYDLYLFAQGEEVSA